MHTVPDIVVDEEMARRASRDIVKRSITGSFIYLLIWFAIIIPNRLYVNNPDICFWITLFYVGMAGCRIFCQVNFEKIYQQSPGLWKAIFYPLILLPALGWGILCSLSFTHPVFEPFFLVLVISTAGLSGGGVTALLPSRALSIGLISCFLLPGLVSTLLVDYQNASLSLMFGIYWIGMYSVTRNLHREYWQGLSYSMVIRKHAAELERLNGLDGLTELHNRLFFDAALRRELKAASRSQSHLSLLLLDIDHFKRVNDRYGHLVGDACLRRMADCLREQVKRETDVVARYGGEEFVVILPDMEIDQAVSIAEKIRVAAEEMDPLPLGLNRSFTISVGVASLIPRPDTSPEQLIEMADSALYRAKNGGRNRVSR